MRQKNLATNSNQLINKGLLYAVTLCLLHLGCTPTPLPTLASKNNIPNDTIPDPIRYLLFGSGKKAPHQSGFLSQEELKLLKEGDILLRRGNGAISDYIADFLKEKYPVTHCGFVVQKGDSLAVLHTISTEQHNGMLIEPLSSYLLQSQAGTLVAVRLKTGEVHIRKAIELAKMLVAKKIPFDMGFDDKNPQTLYCLEMVRNVLKEVHHKDLLPKRKIQQGVDVLSMDNFFDTTYLEVVFNHFENKK